MALILCPHCGAKISDRARACPKCGQTLDAATSPAAGQPAAPSAAAPSAVLGPAGAPDSSGGHASSGVTGATASSAATGATAAAPKRPAPRAVKRPVGAPGAEKAARPAPAAAPHPVHPASEPAAAPKPVPPAKPAPPKPVPPKPAAPVVSEGEGAFRPSAAAPPPPAAPGPEVPVESRGSGKPLMYLLVGILVAAVLVFIFTRQPPEAGGTTETDTQISAGASSPAAESQEPADPNAFEMEATVYTFADNTWLRSSMQKGVDYNKLELLRAGTPLTVLGNYGEWTRVRKQVDGTAGYVATDFVMPSGLYYALVNRTSSAQRSALKMAKYRRAVGVHLLQNENARYGGLVAEKHYTDDASAILLLFSYPDGRKEHVLFGFGPGREIWSVHLAEPAVANPRIRYDGYEFGIGGN